LEKPEGLSAKSAKSGPRVDFPEVQGPLCKIFKISGITNYFLTDNSWTDAGADNGHGDALTGARPPAAPVHQSSSAGAQNGEGGTGSSARASPELGRRRGDRAMAVAQRGHGNSVGKGSSAGEEKRRQEVLVPFT
jgi:hypothetical protein